METVLASAANDRYGYHLLNMLGSVRRNSDIFDRTVVYDLGLDDRQRKLFDGLRDVEVRPVEHFAPHWAKCFSWKPWIWMNVGGDRVVYLDAGATVLRPLDDVLAAIDAHGYFIVGQGIALIEIVPSDYYELYPLARDVANREYVAAGIIGFRRDGAFFDKVLRPTFDDVLLGRNIGFSEGELGQLNWGMTKLDPPIVRDCPHFRHDQTLLNIHLALALPAARIGDLRLYGATTNEGDPEQRIWNHRRACDWRYVAAPAYRFPVGLRARWTRTRLRFGGWRMRNHRFLQPSAYVTHITRALRESQR
jgi:hypothetical protein